MLAWAGPVLQRTGRGFESLHDHLESCTSLVRRDSFGTERRLQITHLHLWLVTGFFLNALRVIATTLSQDNFVATTCFRNLFFLGHQHALCHSELRICLLQLLYFACSNLLYQALTFSGIMAQLLTAFCHTAFCTWELVHSAPLPTSTIST